MVDKEFLVQIVVGDDDEDVVWQEEHFSPHALLARLDEWMRHIKVRLYEDGRCFAEADAYTLLDMKMVDGLRKALGMRQSAEEEERADEKEAVAEEDEGTDEGEDAPHFWGWHMPPAARGYWGKLQPIPFGERTPPLTKGTLGPDNAD